MLNIHSLRFKVTAILSISFILGLLTHTVFIMPILQERGVVSEIENQRNLASRIALHIDYQFQQGKAELEAIARLPSVRSMDKTELDRLISQMDGITQFFNYFFVLNTSGAWVAYPKRPFMVGDRIPDRNFEWVRKTLAENRTVFLDVVESTVNTLVSGFSTPIHDSTTGQTIGLLRGVLTLSARNTAQELISNLKIGSRGYAYLVAANGRLLAHPHHQMRFDRFSEYDYSDYPPVSRLIRGESGVMEYRYEDQTWIAAFEIIPTTGWGIVVHQPKNDVVDEIRESTVWISILLFVSFLLAVLLLLVLLQKSLKPLAELIRRIQTGQIEHRLNYPKDEIGLLASRFNKLYTDLFRSQQQIRSIYKAADDVAFIVTALSAADDSIIEYSSGAEKIFGYRREEIIGQSIGRLNPISDPQLLQQLLMKMQQRHKGTSGEFQLQRKSGEQFAALLTVYPVYIDSGEMESALTVCIDISKRKLTEEALRESETRFRELVDMLPEAVFETEADLNLSFANQRTLELFGCDGDRISRRGLNVFDLIAPQDRHKAAANNALISRGTLFGAVEYRGIRADGSQFPMLLHADRIVKNNQIAGFRGIIVDISDRKEVEKELLNLRYYLENIINSMPSILIGVDRQYRVTLWNRSAEDHTGIGLEAATGRILSEAFPPFQSYFKLLNDAMASRTVQSASRRKKWLKDKVRYEDVTVYPLINDDVQGAVIRIDDATERVQMEEMMIQNEKMQSIGGLAAGMAHEINNPLAGITQNTALLRNRLTGDLKSNHRAAVEAGTSMTCIQAFLQSRRIPDIIDQIAEAGARAAKIVLNMLSFSRQAESDFSRQRITELLDESVALAGNAYDLLKGIDFRRIQVIREYQDNLPELYCDRVKIQQVFLNILRNGAEAMLEEMAENKQPAPDGPRKKPCFILRVNHAAGGNTIRIEMDHNGPGMTEIQSRRIFEPFYTTKPGNRGTGLGLSVSYFIIAENHQGELKVDSTPGRGTRFTITLPLTPPTMEPAIE